MVLKGEESGSCVIQLLMNGELSMQAQNRIRERNDMCMYLTIYWDICLGQRGEEGCLEVLNIRSLSIERSLYNES